MGASADTPQKLAQTGPESAGKPTRPQCSPAGDTSSIANCGRVIGVIGPSAAWHRRVRSGCIDAVLRCSGVKIEGDIRCACSSLLAPSRPAGILEGLALGAVRCRLCLWPAPRPVLQSIACWPQHHGEMDNGGVLSTLDRTMRENKITRRIAWDTLAMARLLPRSRLLSENRGRFPGCGGGRDYENLTLLGS